MDVYDCVPTDNQWWGHQMNRRRLQTMYTIGIALNLLALVYSAMDGEYLFAATFGFVMVYLGVRYWMVSTGKFGN